jgi:hypothetical protein
MANMRTWIDVPDGAAIVMSLDVPPGMIVSGHVACSDSGGGNSEVQDAELRTPSSARRAMTSPPASYTYIVRLTFASACVATFRAHLETATGAQFGKPFTFAPSGQAGKVKLATIVCVMEPPP